MSNRRKHTTSLGEKIVLFFQCSIDSIIIQIFIEWLLYARRCLSAWNTVLNEEFNTALMLTPGGHFIGLLPRTESPTQQGGLQQRTKQVLLYLTYTGIQDIQEHSSIRMAPLHFIYTLSPSFSNNHDSLTKTDISAVLSGKYTVLCCWGIKQNCVFFHAPTWTW